MTCFARQYSDQMQCSCGLAWDVNDPDPPVCRSQAVAVLTPTRALWGSPEIPPPLPPEVASLVAAAHQAVARLKHSTRRDAYEGSALQALQRALKAFP